MREEWRNGRRCSKSAQNSTLGFFVASLVDAGVNFLVGDVRGDVDEIAGSGFGHVFELLTPAHADFALRSNLQVQIERCRV